MAKPHIININEEMSKEASFCSSKADFFAEELTEIYTILAVSKNKMSSTNIVYSHNTEAQIQCITLHLTVALSAQLPSLGSTNKGP